MKKTSARPCKRSPTRAKSKRSLLPLVSWFARRALLPGACLLLAVAAPGHAASKAEAKRGELKELQTRIHSLQKDIGQAEESKDDAADQLRETERAISDANRRLYELTAQKAQVQSALGDLSAQTRQLGERIGEQQRQLGRLLHQQYLAGSDASLRYFLSGNDPNQSARDGYYLSLLSQAKLGLIRGLNESLAEKTRLAEAAHARGEELADIERRQQAQRAQLVEQQKKRQAMLSRIADKIKGQRREVDRLRRDEKRLTSLIDRLSREAAHAARPPRRAAVTAAPSAAPGEPVAHNERLPDGSLAAESFERLKGRLHLPARGELINRYGTPRHDGGGTWKGLFIRSAAGEVKAIAAGRVVFADWLRGFGNLIIVDHGDSYLSIYGNNESLLKTVGQSVKGGETIAAIGNSGGNPQSGLYFELRHRGQPLDPMPWVTLR